MARVSHNLSASPYKQERCEMTAPRMRLQESPQLQEQTEEACQHIKAVMPLTPGSDSWTLPRPG